MFYSTFIGEKNIVPMVTTKNLKTSHKTSIFKIINNNLKHKARYKTII